MVTDFPDLIISVYTYVSIFILYLWYFTYVFSCHNLIFAGVLYTSLAPSSGFYLSNHLELHVGSSCESTNRRLPPKHHTIGKTALLGLASDDTVGVLGYMLHG